MQNNTENTLRKNPNLKSAQSIDLNRSANHLFPILIDFDALGFSRNDLIKLLRKDGILTQVHYIPVMKHPYYANLGHNCDLFPNSVDYYESALSIPLYYGLTDIDQKNFIKIVEKKTSATFLEMETLIKCQKIKRFCTLAKS